MSPPADLLTPIRARRQQERSANLEAFRDGLVRFLICTDVAARGLDIQELPYVISKSAARSTQPRGGGAAVGAVAENRL